MTDINPSPELVQQWLGEFFGFVVSGELSDSEQFLATRAAQWGADIELEACCEWLQDPDLNVDTYKLRAARRPEPLSLKEQAIAVLEDAQLDAAQCNILRRALEQLDA